MFRTALTTELEARGWEIEHMQLRETKIGNCAGDFFCWIRSPGLCKRQRRQPPHSPPRLPIANYWFISPDHVLADIHHRLKKW